MEYFDALRRNGWVSDPGEPFEVVARHAAACPATEGRLCRCTPRLELRVTPTAKAHPAARRRRTAATA